MILLDIDGCITAGKGYPIGLDALKELKQKIHSSSHSTCLCTGRSALYVEAIAQLLDINCWCICENGAYIYHTSTDEVVYHPNITTESRKHLSNIKHSLTTEEKFLKISKIELCKEICISLNPINTSIKALFEYLKSELDLEKLHIAHSTTAVDITPQGISKGSAMAMLGDKLHPYPSQIIGVGDTMGDLSFLELCDTVACPNNAINTIKDMASFVSVQNNTKGLIEIYDWIRSE